MFENINSNWRSAKFVALESRASFHSAQRMRRVVQSAVLALAMMHAAVPLAIAADSGTATLSGVVNINTATLDELQLLPGVGEKRAEAIIGIRKSKGGFQSIDELVAVKGVGDAMLDKLRPHVTLKGKTTARRL